VGAAPLPGGAGQPRVGKGGPLGPGAGGDSDHSRGNRVDRGPAPRWSRLPEVRTTEAAHRHFSKARHDRRLVIGENAQSREAPGRARPRNGRERRGPGGVV
jgi:hypothetical protein